MLYSQKIYEVSTNITNFINILLQRTSMILLYGGYDFEKNYLESFLTVKFLSGCIVDIFGGTEIKQEWFESREEKIYSSL